MKIITSCEVCNSQNLKPVLDLGTHPLCDDLIPIGNDAENDVFPIEIIFCETCRTAHNKYQIDKHRLFTKDYHYRAKMTKDVLNGMEDFASQLDDYMGGIQGKNILDVGCNDGFLLEKLKARGANTIGVDPTDAILEADAIDFSYNEYFDKKTAQKILETVGEIDVICFTNVFAHIENLKGLLEALKVLISDNTVLVIENHYLLSIMKTNQFDTFYHEHPRTYSLLSFIEIAKSLNMVIDDATFPRRYGGNIRVTMTRKPKKSPDLSQALKAEENCLALFADMQSFIENWSKTKRQEILNFHQEHGAVYGKGFPGRAAILMRLLGLDVDIISGVFEQNHSAKIGHYVPATRIPILPDSEITHLSPPVIINLAWHIER